MFPLCQHKCNNHIPARKPKSALKPTGGTHGGKHRPSAPLPRHFHPHRPSVHWGFRPEHFKGCLRLPSQNLEWGSALLQRETHRLRTNEDKKKLASFRGWIGLHHPEGKEWMWSKGDEIVITKLISGKSSLTENQHTLSAVVDCSHLYPFFY